MPEKWRLYLADRENHIITHLEAAREAAKRPAETPMDVQAQMRTAIFYLCDALEELSESFQQLQVR